MWEILVVDDDGIYRTMMVRVLARAGFSVSGVRSGREALDHLKHGTPSVVVTDILMPDMDGLELIREMYPKAHFGTVYAKPKGKPMPERMARANAAKSAIRARVEHVFAHQKNRYGLFIRTIGIARAEAKLTLANLAYNFDRLVFHEKRVATA